jgi:outer membrane murein-binding lipoprotein Lpp
LARCVIVVAVAMLVGACRMSDGPMPDPKIDEVPNQVNDLARDLGNIVAGHEEAREDFVSDLNGWVELDDVPAAAEPIKELGRQIMELMTSTKATEPAMVPLLERTYVALRGVRLSENQVKQLEEDVRSAASQLGADDVKARALGAQAVIVQQAVTERHRRWYEVF